MRYGMLRATLVSWVIIEHSIDRRFFRLDKVGSINNPSCKPIKQRIKTATLGPSMLAAWAPPPP